MKLIRGYKTELDPNNLQKTLLRKHAGAARYAYNWGLARWKTLYTETGKGTNAQALHKELNLLKKNELTWMYEVSKCAPQEALRNLETAFKNFFTGVADYPNFKSKKDGLGSFTLRGSIHVFSRHVKLPRLGKLRLFEKDYIPTDVKIKSATVSERAGHWFVSVLVEEDVPEPIPATGEAAGVDLGINRMATVSDGQTFANPKALAKNLKKLGKLSRNLARKQKGSKNRAKARLKLARLHYHISNIRLDALHKATTAIVAKTKPVSQKPYVIGLEDLNVVGMLKNHKLARAIADVGMGEFSRQLGYKSYWNGVGLFVVDRFYPSSKKCSGCGYVKAELSLSERVYHCNECGLALDRDLNAAINLKQEAVAQYKRVS